jgi:hypothetical protein
MNDDARQRRPGPGRKERVPPRIVALRSETDPHWDASAPKGPRYTETEFRLQNKSNSTEQLESVMRRSQYRGRNSPRSSRTDSIPLTCHGSHSTPL